MRQSLDNVLFSIEIKNKIVFLSDYQLGIFGIDIGKNMMCDSVNSNDAKNLCI